MIVKTTPDKNIYEAWRRLHSAYEPQTAIVECSAMALGLLAPTEGEYAGTIDIHSGGKDNIFPHHECEIA